jgi:hypothetical protein
MIAKYRNRGIIELASAFIMTGILIYFVAAPKKSLRTNEGWIVAAIFLYFAAFVMWIRSGFSFVRAKGYPRDYAGKMFLFLIILGFCFPMAVWVLPAVAIFGLEDKTKTRRR